MSAERVVDQNVLLEPEGLLIPAGSRIAYLFEGPTERTRFAPFMAAGLGRGDLCLIVTDREGRESFEDALEMWGVRVREQEAAGSLLIVMDESSAEAMQSVARTMLEGRRNGSIRFINDTSCMCSRGWTARHMLRFEAKGHMLAQNQNCTMICQYDTAADWRWHLNQIITSHHFTVVSSRVEQNPDHRPRGQVIFDSMGEQLRALTRLQKVSLSLTASLSLDEVLDAILEAAMMICGADCAALSYLDGSGALRLMRHRGLSEEYLRQRHITSSDPAVSPLLTGKEPLIVEDIDSLRGVSPNYEAWKNEGIRSIVSLPLIRGGQVFGMIGAGSRTGRRYTQTGTEAMAILASQASAAITNARLFEQLREANKAKDDFLATLSHELRTPLSPILGWLHMLRRFSDSDPLLKQGIETVERNANQLAGLINDLLDLTRVISGKVELERQPTDLGALVQAAVEQVRPQLTARGLTIDVSLPERRIICNVDSVRIQQVLANLLNNAVKFTPEGGRVSVSIEATGDVSGDVAIEVADTGIGIEANFLPHVFERFTQAHGGINRRYGGLGLGLAITRAIVEAHGGVVTAASDGPRQGSRFRVRLPHVVVDLGTEPEEWLEPAVELGAADKIHARVLVIEDSQDTLEMLELWLRTFGCDVTVAQRAFDALRLAVEEKPDLIISDIGLPEIDGYELIRKLREVPGLETVPAIALTGYARDEDRDLATAAGYDAHLSKPAEMSRLLYLVRKLARR